MSNAKHLIDMQKLLKHTSDKYNRTCENTIKQFECTIGITQVEYDRRFTVGQDTDEATRREKEFQERVDQVEKSHWDGFSPNYYD